MFFAPQWRGKSRNLALPSLQHWVQRGASDHSQGFEESNLGSSPGLLGQYVATWPTSRGNSPNPHLQNLTNDRTPQIVDKADVPTPQASRHRQHTDYISRTRFNSGDVVRPWVHSAPFLAIILCSHSIFRKGAIKFGIRNCIALQFHRSPISNY